MKSQCTFRAPSRGQEEEKKGRMRRGYTLCGIGFSPCNRSLSLMDRAYALRISITNLTSIK